MNASAKHRSIRFGRAACSLLLAVSVVGWLGGCSRNRARVKADQDAYHLLDQKSTVAGGKLCDYRLPNDPSSRNFDPYDPDSPPMPPDDPTSHHYMECVDGKRGAKLWRKSARTPHVENPDWRARLGLDDQGRLRLDTRAAVRLGLVNDPEYRTELEELYLSALDVSFERFRFGAQLFGGSSIFFQAAGREASGTGEASSQLFVSPSSRTRGPATPNRWRVQRLTATGGELAAGFANTLVWQFSGPDDYAGITLLDFSLMQPLLRGGGRVRILERLTVAERTLLSNVRAMERYRREFYLNVVTGRFPGGGVERRGGILGGAGLANFAGVGLRIGAGQGFFGGGFNNAGVAGAEAAGGFLGLLQTQQVLRNQRANVAGLRDSTLQLEASYEAGRIDRFQVDLARQALFNAQSQLLRAEADFATTFDNFKVGLGLPPDLRLEADDPLLEPFNLLDPKLTELQDETAGAVEGARGGEGAAAGPVGERGALAETPNKEAGPELLPAQGADSAAAVASDPLLAEVKRLIASAGEQFAVVELDFKRLEEVAPDRRKHLKEIGARPEVREVKIDPALFDPAIFDKRLKELATDIAGWKLRLDQLEKEAGSPPPAAKNAYQGAQGAKPVLTPQQQRAEAAQRLLTRLSGLLLDLSILQARARLDAIDLDPTELTSEQALQIAAINRPDWANARASLVDAWRLIFFNANDLKSAVDVVFSGDLGTSNDRPFGFDGANGRLRVGLEFDSPTSRLAERNVYRQSLIEYQQARRNYYQFVDRLHQGLRQTLRQVRLNEINLELRREAVFVAIAQVDLTQLRLLEPPKPGATEQFTSTTARDLVEALSNLLLVQNDLLSVWVNNQVQRLNLELDLGLMLLDAEGQRVALNEPFASFVPIDPAAWGGDVQGAPNCGIATPGGMPLPIALTALPGSEVELATTPEAQVKQPESETSSGALRFPEEVSRPKPLVAGPPPAAGSVSEPLLLPRDEATGQSQPTRP